MQISFSVYVNQLIRKDLGRSAVFDWSHETDRRQPAPIASPRQAGMERFKEASPLTKPDSRAK